MLNYIKIGNGPKIMIAFHGFGQKARMFEGFDKVFPDYTIYSMSLYYHGSEWKYQNQPMNEKVWTKIFTRFLTEQGIGQFGLLGYSIGGKVALYTYQLFSEQVERLELMAPYGIKSNPWEQITQKAPFIFRQLESVVHQPAYFFKLLEILKKYKLVNKTLLDITKRQLNSWDSRFRAYHTIGLYGRIRLNLQEINLKMKKTSIPVTFYLGHYDSVLTLEALNKLVGNLMNFSLHVLPTGHNSLPDKVIKVLDEKSVYTLQKKSSYKLAS